MIAKRIIPCLDVCNGRVVKGVKFDRIQDVQSPVELAGFYNNEGADELVFYDITASCENRSLFSDVLKKTAEEVFIPLTVGGGINTVKDFEKVLNCGADKVSVNTGAVKNPDLIGEAAKLYGNQCVVLSVDVKFTDGRYCVYINGGRTNTRIDALDWIKRAEDEGAGEIVVNSIDTDGVKNGFDIPLLKKVAERVSVPVIASGGAGNIEHFIELFKTVPNVDAGLAASIFHYREVSIAELKKRLAESGVEVRI